ncbi:hypothetical protein SDD30_13990 [Moorella naiadis]|uniref:hypothetical protein n=1 Tax=Moorella naiadis (nom. illeg.) TaxID=3093670 RepID=UPI003D9CBB49
MNKKLLASVGTGVMLLGSVIGISTAYSQAAKAAPTTPPPAIVQPAQVQPAQTPEEKAVGTVDKDNLQVQQGSQLQDTKGTDTEKGTAAEEAKGKEVKTKEEANENLPGGGHSDPQGANVDHQFNGVE